MISAVRATCRLWEHSVPTVRQAFLCAAYCSSPGSNSGGNEDTNLDNQSDKYVDNSESGSGNIDFGFQNVKREEKQNLVREIFSNVAPSYDLMNDLMSGGLHRIWKDKFVENLSPFPGMRHIDVAGGTGDIAFRVLRAIEAEERSDMKYQNVQDREEGKEKGSVTVFDINPEMLQEGKKKALSRRLDASRLHWVEGSAEALPFENNSFDSYTIAFGIRNVTDRNAALQEAYRILRPGGRFLCLEFSKLTAPLLQQIYDEYSFRVIPEIGRIVAGDFDSYKYLVESIRMFPDQEEFARMIEHAGFLTVKYDNLTGGVVAIHSGIKL